MSSSCAKKRKSAIENALTSLPNQPSNLPKGVKRYEVLIDCNYLPETEYVQQRIKFPDCLGYDEWTRQAQEAACTSASFKDKIKFPNIVNVHCEIIQMNGGPITKPATNLVKRKALRASWFLAETSVLGSKISDGEKTGDFYQALTPENVLGIATVNNALYYKEYTVGWASGNIPAATADVLVSPGGSGYVHGYETTMFDRQCGYQMYQPFINMYTVVQGNMNEKLTDVERCLTLKISIDYRLHDVSVETLWLQDQNLQKFKPEVLQWQLNNDRQDSDDIRMQTLYSGGQIAAPVKLVPDSNVIPGR